MDKQKLLAALQAALAQKNQAQLEELGKQAVIDFPNDSFGYAYLAEYFLLESPSNYPKAETCLVKAIEFDAANMEYINKFAGLKEEQGLYEDARILYLKALHKDANNVTALTNMGLYELRISKMLDKSIEYLKKAATLDPQDKNIQLHLAEAYFEAKDLGEALVAVSKAITDEFDEPTTLMLIKVLDALGDKPKALKVYDRLVLERPTVAAYRFDFANRLYDSNVCGETIIQTQKGLELMGDEHVEPIFYQPMLKSLYLLKRYDEVIQILNGFIKNDPNNVAFYIQRADSIFAKDDFDATIKEYHKILELLEDPNLNIEYRKRLGYLLMRVGKIGEAKAIFEEMTKSELYAPVGNCGLGLMAFKEGNLEEAYSLMKKAKLKGNKDAEDFIYQKMQDYLIEKRTQLLAKNAVEASKNSASAFIQKITGVLWQFDTMQSEALKDQAQQIKDTINNSLQSFSVTFTEKGALFVKSIQADAMVYKILSESASSVQLELTNLDGTKVINATLTLQNGDLTFSEKAGENLNFKKANLSDISVPVYKAYMRTMTPDDMEFLGAKAKVIVETFFQPA